MVRLLVSALALPLALQLALPLAQPARAGGAPANVSPDAWAAAGTGSSEVLIVLRERADLSSAEGLPLREDKAFFVVLALRATAQRSQKDLHSWLAAAHVPFRPFYIVNCVWARATQGQMAAVAARPEVDHVAWNPWVKGILEDPRQIGRDPASGAAPRPLAVEWNVAQIGAPAVWASGHRGEGIVVGGQDTGVRWTHELLKARYRGWELLAVGIMANHVHLLWGCMVTRSRRNCSRISKAMGVVV